MTGIYTEKNYDAEARISGLKIATNVKAAFKDSIQGYSWMDLETKQHMLEKLDKVEPYMATPEDVRKHLDTIKEYYEVKS